MTLDLPGRRGVCSTHLPWRSVATLHAGHRPRGGTLQGRRPPGTRRSTHHDRRWIPSRPHKGTRGGLRPLEVRAGLGRMRMLRFGAPPAAARRPTTPRAPSVSVTRWVVISPPEPSRPASLGIWHARAPLRRADAHVGASARWAVCWGTPSVVLTLSTAGAAVS